MNYKEKYENLIEQLKKAKEEHGGYTFSSVIDKIVPELRESEDEKIWKVVKGYINQHYPVDSPVMYKSKILNWLENQKPIKLNEEDGRIRKSIIGFLKIMSSLKDGKTVSKEDFDSVALLEWAAWLEKKGEQKPALNEYDLAMIDNLVTDETCPLDSEYLSWLKSLKERVQPQPKQEWSEEEKARIDKIVDVLDWAEEKGRISYSDWRDYVTYVKSLKPQNKQNITWSEEDEKILKELVEEVKDQIDSVPSPDCMDKEDEKVLKQLNKWMNWLKTIKPHWKPSKEQMEALKFAANDYCMGETKKNLESLYNDLLKL